MISELLSPVDLAEAPVSAVTTEALPLSTLISVALIGWNPSGAVSVRV